jgi:hypothetical protein
MVTRRDYRPDAYGWGTYRDSHGDTVDLLVNYGSPVPHDSIHCFWLRAQDASWHQLVALKALNSTTAVFDVAIFMDAEATPLLVASTSAGRMGVERPYM